MLYVCIIFFYENTRKINTTYLPKSINSNYFEFFLSKKRASTGSNFTSINYFSFFPYRHTKSIHEKNEIYVCDTCGFKTYHPYSLTAHVLQVHQKFKPNKCDFCDASFFYKRDKIKHMAKNHGSKESW